MKQNLMIVTGPSRSGKSEWAEKLAAESIYPVIYVATSLINSHDHEWQARIAKHKLRRPKSWLTIESCFNLIETIEQANSNQCLLIDSLGTWIANFMERDQEVWTEITESLLMTVQHSPAEIIFVSEETGWGVVPAYASGRLFRDRLGNLTRSLSAIAGEVYLVTAGYAINLKRLGQVVPRL
jgi:adenosylcobinamide kinase/adenosylcobinamide-phosphate guanylyltransferase